MGTILGCNSIKFSAEGNMEGTRQAGKECTAKGRSQLLREMLRELTYLIWNMRCKRSIGNRDTPHGTREIATRWRDRTVDRFKANRVLALHVGKPKRLIEALAAKWGDIIDTTTALDKIQEPINLKGFLVGTERPP
jgi:hypothetical protein